MVMILQKKNRDIHYINTFIIQSVGESENILFSVSVDNPPSQENIPQTQATLGFKPWPRGLQHSTQL